MSPAPQPRVQAFFDAPTWTVTYVVYDREGGKAAIIDSVLNYDHKSGRTRTTGADEIIAFIKELCPGVEPQGVFDALNLGAVDYVAKPGGTISLSTKRRS